MRQIGSLPDQDAAEQFCDFLAAQDIEAVYRQDPSDWSVWSLDNNATEAAKSKLTELSLIHI